MCIAIQPSSIHSVISITTTMHAGCSTFPLAIVLTCMVKGALIYHYCMLSSTVVLARMLILFGKHVVHHAMHAWRLSMLAGRL